MRIAIANWSSRKVGGVENYLNAIIPKLVESGNSVAFCYEVDDPAERTRIGLPPEVPSWCVTTHGTQIQLRELESWQPDVIYTHKLNNPDLEEALQEIAPSILFCHDYQGMCISGTKMLRFPSVTPCDRRLGAPCLLNYFPRRCGGLSPLTMLSLYRTQIRRMNLLTKYSAVVTHSEHMGNELIRHGVERRKAFVFPFLVDLQLPAPTQVATEPQSQNTLVEGNETRQNRDYVQLFFSARMERSKGGDVLLDALPIVQRALGKRVRVIFAGDGRKRAEWEHKANRLLRQHDALEIKFVGWVEPSRLNLLLDQSDLIVIPSVWPEPFGMVGPEAALRGVPAVAFAVGGIPEWLIDGVNGYLAHANPPTSLALAEAVGRCLRDAPTYESLRREALRLANQFNAASHLTNLINVFNHVLIERHERPVAMTDLASHHATS
jgi:glycosyltransferase involved in cell wall biosynthesis